MKNVLLPVLFFILSGTLRAQNADEILAGYASFAGGTAAWSQVQTIVTKGTYNYGGIEFPFTTYSKAPNLYKFIVPFNGKYFEQAFDGKTGWKIDAFNNETSKTILTGKAARALANEADVELESPLLNYRKKGNTALLLGKDTVAGTLCYNVQLTRKDGTTEIWSFDVATFAPVRKQAPAKNTELDSAMLDTYFSDYRKVGKIQVPYQVASKINGQTILSISLSEVQLNQPVANSAFKRGD